MSALREVVSTGAARAGAVFIAVVTLGCCFVPGFDSLGYYASLAIALAGSVVAGWVGVAEGARTRERAERARSVFGKAALATWPLLVIPPTILLINALWVRNCDPVEGFGFFVMCAGLSMLFASQMGAACAITLSRPLWAGAAFTGIWILWLGRDLAHLYVSPAIFGFNPFVGYFSGAVYDAAIQVDSRLFAFRGANLCALCLVWWGASMAWDRRAGRVSIERLRCASWRSWLLLAAIAVAWGGLHGMRGHLGYEVTRDHLRRELGGVWEGDRIVVHYDRPTISEVEARHIHEDLVYRLHTLETALDDHFPEPVHAYVYASSARKRALMGGAVVDVAKPWLGEIHVNRPAFGDPVLGHELAHVVLGKYAHGPLQVPAAWGVLLHVAVVEGAAEALEWSGDPLTHHQWSAAMRRLGLAPDLARIMDPEGFWMQPAGRAYTLSGSFMRWLLDTRGPDLFKRVYADGDFAAAYGETTESLVRAWEGFVDAQELPAEALALARRRFDVKAVLRSTCPLEIARMEAEAVRLARDGQDEAAIALRREVIGFVPESARKRVPLIHALARLGRVEELDAAVADALSLDGLDSVTRTALEEIQADGHWRAGDRKGARAGYERIASADQSEDRRRNVLVKRDVVSHPGAEPILGPYLLGPGGDESISYLTEAVADLPRDPLAIYLLGRRLAHLRRPEEAVGPLRSAIALLTGQAAPAYQPSTRSLLRREALRLLGESLYLAGSWHDARETFLVAHALAGEEGRRNRLQDWIDRCRWRAESQAVF